MSQKYFDDCHHKNSALNLVIVAYKNADYFPILDINAHRPAIK